MIQRYAADVNVLCQVWADFIALGLLNGLVPTAMGVLFSWSRT